MNHNNNNVDQPIDDVICALKKMNIVNDIKTHKYCNSIVISYIVKMKEYEKYQIQIHHNNKKIVVYKTPILTLALDIFNNHINDDNMLFIIDPKHRQKWIDNYIKDIELSYYRSTKKTNFNIHANNNCKIELTISQHHYSYLNNCDSVQIKLIIENHIGRYNANIIDVYESDNFINASKAFDYIVSCTCLYKLYFDAIENNDYLHVIAWIINNKYLRKLKNKFEARMRTYKLTSSLINKKHSEFINQLGIEHKKYFSKHVLTLLPKKI